MLFSEFRFLPFFLVVFAVHWALRANVARKSWLLVASYVFYAAWDWRFLGLIVASTLVDYAVGLALGRAERHRGLLLSASLVANLGMLGFFKYWGFFVDSTADLLRLFGFQPHLPTLQIVLPVGISFYTFQTLSYSFDVWARRLRPTANLLDLSLFVAFFPQLVAGPIVRASDFLPQLTGPRVFARVDVRSALVLILVGFVKKACVSDNLAPVIDPVFAKPWDYDAASVWGATLYYAVQIYCDFSGYSDMAIGLAALLGYRLCLNFHFPYFAANVTEFWRRWHISLSTWLRDYLYVPLGGGRGSRWFVHRNLLLTMLLGGLWHGAAWNFVLWGGLHGAALVVHREWRRLVPPASAVGTVFRRIGPVLTFSFVCICWILFRAVGTDRSTSLLASFLSFSSEGKGTIGRSFLWIFPAFVVAHALAFQGARRRPWQRLPAWVFAALLAVATAVALSFVATESKPFIYFQF